MNSERKLKQYMFRKFGTCFNCKEKIPIINCHIECPNCGYAENWHELPTYLDDRSNDESTGDEKADKGKDWILR